MTGQRYAVEFLALIGVVVVALGLALGTGALADPVLTAMRWLAPPWVAVYVCARADALAALRRDGVHRTFRLALPMIALYGLAQFVAIAPWDAYFMQAAPIDSIGYPEPFQVRVFATMNSPGSFTAMLGTGTLLLLPTTKGLGWIGILLSAAALFLTTQRAALGALVIAILAMLLMSRDPATRRSIGRTAVAVAAVCGIMLSVPGAARKLMTTAASISQLDQDGSAQARWQQYDDLLPLLDGHEFGRGLGWATNSLYVHVDNNISLDSGLIDIFVGLGLPGGMVFLAALGMLSFEGVRICRRAAGDGEFAAVLFGLAQLPLGSQHTGEHGPGLSHQRFCRVERPAGRDKLLHPA